MSTIDRSRQMQYSDQIRHRYSNRSKVVTNQKKYPISSMVTAQTQFTEFKLLKGAHMSHVEISLVRVLYYLENIKSLSEFRRIFFTTSG